MHVRLDESCQRFGVLEVPTLKFLRERSCISVWMALQIQQEIVVSFDKIGLESDRATPACERFIELSLDGQRDAERVVGLVKIGVERDGLPTNGDGVVEPRRVDECIAEMAVGFRRTRIDDDRLPKRGDGLIELSHLLERNTEVGVRCGKAGSERVGLMPGRDHVTELFLVFQGCD